MDNVTVQRNAFVFCRYSVALLVWAALVLKSAWLLGLVLAILAVSAVVTVRWAPMVWLYTVTAGRFIESPPVVLDIKAMRVAHGLGALLALISLSLVLRGSPFAWYFVAFFALMKSLSALGFCPAYKLYGCMSAGGCCAVSRKLSGGER